MRPVTYLSIAISSLLPISASGAIPLTLTPAGDGARTPIFVALELAAPDGRLHDQWLDEAAAARIERRIHGASARQTVGSANRRSAAGQPLSCDVLVESEADYFQSEPTPAEVLRQSTAVVAGQIGDRISGFYRGELATLYEVVVEDVLRWPDDLPRPQSVLIKGQSSEEVLNGVTYCTRLSGARVQPAVGSSVIVATFRELGGPGAPLVDGRYLITPLPEELIVREGDIAHWKDRSPPWGTLVNELKHHGGSAGVEN